MVAVVGEGGMATATALAATTTTSTMTTTIPCPLPLTSLSSGASVFAALDQRRRWDGNGVAVVNKAGRTAVDRDGAMVPLAAMMTTTIPTPLPWTSSSSGAFIFTAME